MKYRIRFSHSQSLVICRAIYQAPILYSTKRKISKIDLENWNPLIFLHIPKCAGTTIESMLKNRYGDKHLSVKDLHQFKSYQFTSDNLPDSITLKHIPLDSLNEIFGRGFDINSKQVFTIIRDPYHRFVSIYNYLTQKGQIPRNMNPDEVLKHLIKNFMSPSLLTKGIPLAFAAPQSYFFGDVPLDCVNIYPLSYVGEFGLQEIKGSLKHENKARESKFVHSIKTRELIQEFYAKDYLKFKTF